METRYDTTKEMNRAHDEWFIAHLRSGKPTPIEEIHDRLSEVHYNFKDRMQEMRGFSDVSVIYEELAELTKAMIFFDHLFPKVEQEVFRVLRDLETIFAEGYRTYQVKMDLESFQGDRVEYRLVNSDGKNIQFKTSSRFQRYASSFPSKWCSMDAAAIKKEMR